MDDGKVHRLYIEQYLKKSGFLYISKAKSGLEAIHLIENNRYDVVLLDNEMPDMNGQEVLMIIRHGLKMKDLKIFMLTSDDKEETIVDAISGGANYYAIKGNNLDTLIQKIKTA